MKQIECIKQYQGANEVAWDCYVVYEKASKD